MNLSKLFEAQAILDKRIVEEKGLEGQDLLDKKILALQVELGELANEWRGFKFWSEDQKPNVDASCDLCDGKGEKTVTISDFHPSYGYATHYELAICPKCKGNPIYKNPLLEEYVDCLHFMLSIGLEIGIKSDEMNDLFIWNSPGVDQLNSLFAYTSELYTFIWSVEYTKKEMKSKYKNLLEGLLGFGVYGLRFTWKQIEQAYLKKNKINHERQASGY